MGRYLNPRGMSKEMWLEQNAKKHGMDSPFVHQNKEGDTAAVLVDNGGFTACALADSVDELRAFTHTSDIRPKFWFWIPEHLTGNFG